MRKEAQAVAAERKTREEDLEKRVERELKRVERERARLKRLKKHQQRNAFGTIGYEDGPARRRRRRDPRGVFQRGRGPRPRTGRRGRASADRSTPRGRSSPARRRASRRRGKTAEVGAARGPACCFGSWCGSRGGTRTEPDTVSDPRA